jgi:hypothetical protein
MRNRIYLAMTVAGVILCGLAYPATAQTGSDIGQVLTGGPISIGAGDHALVCATNLGSQPVSVNIQLLNALTGAVVLQTSTTLGVARGPVGRAHREPAWTPQRPQLPLLQC